MTKSIVTMQTFMWHFGRRDCSRYRMLKQLGRTVNSDTDFYVTFYPSRLHILKNVNTNSSSRPLRRFCVTQVSIVAIVSAVLCDPSQHRRNRFGGFVWPESASSRSFRRFCHDVVWFVFNRIGVGAYRIRPHVGEHAPQTMPVRSPHTCNIANMKGVCDPPLHTCD